MSEEKDLIELRNEIMIWQKNQRKKLVEMKNNVDYTDNSSIVEYNNELKDVKSQEDEKIEAYNKKIKELIKPIESIFVVPRGPPSEKKGIQEFLASIPSNSSVRHGASPRRKITYDGGFSPPYHQQPIYQRPMPFVQPAPQQRQPTFIENAANNARSILMTYSKPLQNTQMYKTLGRANISNVVKRRIQNRIPSYFLRKKSKRR